MAYNKKEAQTKIQAVGDAMVAHKYDEAWACAGALNAYLKQNKEVMTGLEFEIINQVLKEYYAMNKQIEALSKRAYAMGKKAQGTQL